MVQYCEGVPRILVGCKSDMRRGEGTSGHVAPEQAKEVAERIQAYKYLECSAKSGEGLQEVFEYAARASLLSRKKFRRAQKTGGPAPSNQRRSKRCTIG